MIFNPPTPFNLDYNYLFICVLIIYIFINVFIYLFTSVCELDCSCYYVFIWFFFCYSASLLTSFILPPFRYFVFLFYHYIPFRFTFFFDSLPLLPLLPHISTPLWIYFAPLTPCFLHLLSPTSPSSLPPHPLTPPRPLPFLPISLIINPCVIAMWNHTRRGFVPRWCITGRGITGGLLRA